MKTSYQILTSVTLLCVLLWHAPSTPAELPEAFLKAHCFDCHYSDNAEAGLNLKTLGRDFDPEAARRWVRVHDRLASGEMPPRDAKQPSMEERTAAIKSLKQSLITAEKKSAADVPRLRRLTRSEYETRFATCLTCRASRCPETYQPMASRMGSINIPRHSTFRTSISRSILKQPITFSTTLSRRVPNRQRFRNVGSHS